jgi:hypothetical protein
MTSERKTRVHWPRRMVESVDGRTLDLANATRTLVECSCGEKEAAARVAAEIMGDRS